MKKQRPIAARPHKKLTKSAQGDVSPHRLAKWKGYCAKQFAEQGYQSVDEFIEDVRGR